MNAESPGLVFLTNEAGEDEGLGHAGVETYKDSPYASVGRECGQNSRDEARQLPVDLRFDLVRIPRSEYPLHVAQSDAVAQCLAKARAKKDDKEIEFFQRAKEVLAQDEIALLKIEDRNTKGLIGPAIEGKPFHSLVKASGVSVKDSDTSGGSFGIGKFAAFAVSELQTVFYSTAYIDPVTGKPTFLAQGKTILVSHRSTDGKRLRATGYWGMPGFQPVEDRAAVPAWLRRTDVGTSVIIAGFRESAKWQYTIAASLLQNFFCGIQRGEVRFLINGGEIDINQGTLAALFADKAITEAAVEADGGEDFRFARNLYECLNAPDAIRQDLLIEGIGPVSFIMLMRDGLPKRVRIIRNGMSITDELSAFGDKLASFPMYRDFVAVVEPREHDGNKLFKRLENPRHDALSAERLSDPNKRAEATTAMKKLAKAIRQAIKEKALSKPEERADLNELTEYFDTPEAGDAPPSPTDEENPEILRFEATEPRKRHRPQSAGAGTGTGGGGGQGGRGGGGDGSRGGRPGSGSGGSGRRGEGAPVDLTDVRNVVALPKTRYSRRLFFTPAETCKASIEIRAAGLDMPAGLMISAADAGSVSGGMVLLDVTAGKRETLSVAFSTPYPGPIEVVASRVEA